MALQTMPHTDMTGPDRICSDSAHIFFQTLQIITSKCIMHIKNLCPCMKLSELTYEKLHNKIKMFWALVNLFKGKL